jgi:hypothetical protein
MVHLIIKIKKTTLRKKLLRKLQNWDSDAYKQDMPDHSTTQVAGLLTRIDSLALSSTDTDLSIWGTNVALIRPSANRSIPNVVSFNFASTCAR